MKKISALLMSTALISTAMIPAFAHASPLKDLHQLWALDPTASNVGACAKMIEVYEDDFFGKDSVIINRGESFNSYLQIIESFGDQDHSDELIRTQYADDQNTLTVSEFKKHFIIGTESDPSVVTTIHMNLQNGYPASLAYRFSDKNDASSSMVCAYRLGNDADPIPPKGCTLAVNGVVTAKCTFQPKNDRQESCALAGTTVTRDKSAVLSMLSSSDQDQSYWVDSADKSSASLDEYWKSERSVTISAGTVSCDLN